MIYNMLMLRKINRAFLYVGIALSLLGCRNRNDSLEKPEEDFAAKRSMQGIWLDDDGDDVAFRIKGDSVYFPDSTSAAAYFRIERDSFVVVGGNTVKYHIVKQTPHLFIFINQGGDRVRLTKTSDASYLEMFAPKKIQHVNQNMIIKHDTVCFYDAEKYHCYVQVNPTTYKVAKTTYNEDGVEVDNIYYDNIVNLSIYNGAAKLFSRDMRKELYEREVPAEFLRQAVLSDMTFMGADREGLHFFAMLAIPETSIMYMVENIITYNGQIKKRIKK